MDRTTLSGTATWIRPLTSAASHDETQALVMEGGRYFAPGSAEAPSPYLLGALPSGASATAPLLISIDTERNDHVAIHGTVKATVGAACPATLPPAASQSPKFTLTALRFNAVTGLFSGEGTAVFPDPGSATDAERRFPAIVRGIIDVPGRALGQAAILYKGSYSPMGFVSVTPE
jgi:hypothetical protein